VCAHNYTDVLL